MPRKSRIHYRNAFHHVMLRGNYRQNIFLDNDDRVKFINVLSNSMESYSFNIHLFCLMTNHIHLVIEVGDIPISKIMQCINAKYVRWHNLKYKRNGHLFQGRFNSKLIHDDKYLLELCYYIHMNPVKAKICQSPDEYLWSSHHSYVNGAQEIKITTSKIIGLLGQYYGQGGHFYRKYMKERNAESLKSDFCTFDEDGNMMVQPSVYDKKFNQPMLSIENISLKTIMRIVCDCLDIKLDEIVSCSQARRITLARSMVTYYGHYHAKYTLEDIAGNFHMRADSVSKTLQRHLRKAQTCKEIRRIMIAVERKLSVLNPDSLMTLTD